MPSSQVLQFVGHGWHLGPKNPDAQDSQDTPVNPEGHWQLPEDVHTPDAEQLGVQAEDSMSKSERAPWSVCGSCPTSGIASQTMTRPLDTVFSAIHTFDDSTRAFAGIGIDELTSGVVGREEKEAWPE
jgi:hypothetical protein